MTPAIFGITNGAVNTIVALLLLSLVFMWLALIWRAFADAERRIEDPFLVRLLPLWAVFPFVGYWIYSIIRPPEYLEDVREREIETKAAEMRLAMMHNRTCRNCGYEVEPSYLRCPSCLRKLKEPCENCAKPLDPRWRVCPYCEVEVKRAAPAPPTRRARPARDTRAKPKAKPEPATRRSPATRPRVAEEKPERVVPTAAERQRRSLSSVKGDPKNETADEASERLSAAAAIGPKRGSNNSDAPSEAASESDQVSEAAKRAAARRASASKKTSSRGKK